MLRNVYDMSCILSLLIVVMLYFDVLIVIMLSVMVPLNAIPYIWAIL